MTFTMTINAYRPSTKSKVQLVVIGDMEEIEDEILQLESAGFIIHSSLIC